MQIKISFTSDRDIVLPIHYNNIIQGFIYNNIDDKLAAFLHDGGYTSKGRNFKLFSFSRILGKGKKEDQRFNFGRNIEFIVSSPLDDFCKSIANFMLQRDDLYLGQNNIKTDQIQIFNNTVDKDEIVVDTLSPIVTYSTLLRQDGRKYTCYFMPGEADFDRIITENLIKKYNALNKRNNRDNKEIIFDESVNFIPLTRVRQNLTYYKNIVIKGSSGKFLVKGDSRLLQVGLDAGFGSKNSQGFGCVKII
jgi:CRISPR-associated endoribonuclease Cas6